ncbi:MAG: aldehyde dehydrogenase [Gammaproteobacteria bacterium]|nr:MAG: aldehyde dehydrogenase [Gammaproteobacteria bacterium]
MGPDLLNYSIREPYGVCARILAYNHPILFASTKIGSAIAAGNSLILKPPVQAPLSAYRMMELLEDAFPPGVLNLITCGQPGSEALVSHPLVPRISLIGSAQTGRAIAATASQRLKHVSMELGGKNACIVYPEANIAEASAGAVAGMNLAICGQSCGSTSRLFIHQSVYDEVLKKVAAGMSTFQPGEPTDPSTLMGCLISMDHRGRVERMVADAVSAGARVVIGGAAPNDPNFTKRPYYMPTILADVTADMDIAQQEVFGPVLSVIRWQDEEELFAAVNSVEYGLTASIWTQDLSQAHRAAQRVDSGFVWINRTSSHFPGVSFGGFKQSGLGKEESLEELLSFTREKVITVAL